MTKNPLIHMFYSGPSMNPTFKKGDVLCIVPYHGSKIHRGDVITFRAPGRSRYTTHRVISVNSRGIITLGDDNTEVDNYILQYNQVVGRVSHILRKQRRIRIYGGTPGQLILLITRLLRTVRRCFVSVLKPIYSYLVHSSLIAHILPHVRIKIVTFNRPNGTDRKLLVGRWVIGWYVPRGSYWHIRPPFKLLVDEKSLLREKENHYGSSTGTFYK